MTGQAERAPWRQRTHSRLGVALAAAGVRINRCCMCGDNLLRTMAGSTIARPLVVLLVARDARRGLGMRLQRDSGRVTLHTSEGGMFQVRKAHRSGARGVASHRDPHRHGIRALELARLMTCRAL